MKQIKLLVITLILSYSAIIAQDTTRSQAFKDTRPWRQTYFKAKYPSYPLLAGYLLVTEANRGDPFAQHELGIRYLLGQGFPNDTVKAIYWIRKAADQNLAAAHYNYAILLYNAIGVPWNPFEAYSNFKKASDAGMPDAHFAVGINLIDNLVVNRNYTEAHKLFTRAANAGYEPAKKVLEQFKKQGLITKNDSSNKNISNEDFSSSTKLINPDWDLDFYDFENEIKKNESTEEIQQLLDKRSSELKIYFGLTEEDEKINLPDTSGLGILKFAADKGSPEAILITARGYETGTFFQKDQIIAASNYLRAFRLGSFKAAENLFKMVQEEKFINTLRDRISTSDPEAMYVLAGITALGFSNRITEQQALELLKNAVAKKHLPSMIELGLCYSSGTLVDKDIQQAIYYWNAAKKLGSIEASVRIAFTQIADSSVNINTSEQIEVLIHSSNGGSVLAQTLLAYCYEKGLGLKENKSIASRLYRQAAQRGNQTAYNSLKRMYDEIRPLDEEFLIYESD